MTARADKTEHIIENSDFVANEIELIEYLRVIWKWKYKILAGTMICAVIAGIVGFKAPQPYRVEIILKLYELYRTRGIPVYIDPPEDIESLLEYGMLTEDISAYLKKAKNRDIDTISEFKVTRLGAGNFLQITYDTSDAQLGVDILNGLKPVLLKKYEEKVNFLQDDYYKYQNKKGDIDQLQVDMEVLKTDINNLSKRINELKVDLDFQNSNLKLMVKRRDQLIEENKNSNMLFAYLYNNTIQQKIALIHTYKNDLFQYISDRDFNKAELKKLTSKIIVNQRELRAVESAQNNFQYIQVIRPPDDNVQPLKAKTRQYALFGLVLGLFIMISISFFFEFILKPHSKKVK